MQLFPLLVLFALGITWSMPAVSAAPPDVADVISVDDGPAAVPDSLAQQAASDPLRRDPRIVDAITQFQRFWHRKWKQSEEARHQLSSNQWRGRLRYVHCHRNQSLLPRPRRPNNNDDFVAPDTVNGQVAHRNSAFAVCPSWLLYPLQDAIAGDIDADGAIRPEYRDAVRDARKRLLVVLDSAFGVDSLNAFLAGQRVRFHVDQGNLDAAWQAALSCRMSAWWCNALLGYAMHKRGGIVEAESLYARMRETMLPQDRCEWMDVSVLLEQTDRQVYAKWPCAERIRLTERLWWLSDPMFRVAGNERLVEQESRRVLTLLKRALAQDERWNWDDARGGSAVMGAVLRYGWPTFTAWGGSTVDASHSGYLQNLMTPAATPYTTFEYSSGRAQVIPMLAAAVAPFESLADDWVIAVDRPDGQPSTGWWPIEHFRPAKRLVALGEGQVAFFRRESFNVVYAAMSVAHRAADAAKPFDAMLLVARGPNRMDTLANIIERANRRVVLNGTIDTAPGLLSFEAVSADMDARVRYGIAPPPTLEGMRKGEIALSDPVLLDDGAADAMQELTTSEALLAHMIPAPYVGPVSRRVAVFWESYGIAAGDSVLVSVRVSRDVSVGRLQRIGIRLNLTNDPATSVAIRWTEPHPAHGVRTLSGPTPVQMRAIALDLTALPAGPYLLEVMMERGKQVVRSQRRFSIVS